jgi:hypothetical protein
LNRIEPIGGRFPAEPAFPPTVLLNHLQERQMIRLKIFGAAIVVAAMIAAPIAAQADEYVRRHRHHHHHHHYHHHRHIAWFSYLHNYGPGPLPGTYAYYDGPTSVRCKQSAAAYRGQDGRRHPCN